MYAARPRLRTPLLQNGFTLIELMIAVVVVALLASVAYPSFLDSIRKSRRADAYAALIAVTQAQERFRANSASYASSLTNAANGSPPGLALPSSNSQDGYYTLSLDNVTSTGYEVIATAQSGKSQANDGDCVRLRIRLAGGNLMYGSASSAGAFTEATGNRCWSR